MSKSSFVIGIVIAIYAVCSPANCLKRDWTYRLVQINWNSSDLVQLQMPIRPVRVGPGVYGVNGSFLIGLDAGDEYSIEVILMRSASGSSQYGITPFSIPSTPLTKFMNTHYRTFFKETMKNCSTLPQFDEKWAPPLKKGEYTMYSCVIGTENFPRHMQPGLYKILVIVRGPSLFAVLEALAQVDPQYV